MNGSSDAVLPEAWHSDLPKRGDFDACQNVEQGSIQTPSRGLAPMAFHEPRVLHDVVSVQWSGTRCCHHYCQICLREAAGSTARRIRVSSSEAVLVALCEVDNRFPFNELALSFSTLLFDNLSPWKRQMF